MQKSLANGLRSIGHSAASIASRTALAATEDAAAAPRIELSTTDLKERNNNNNSSSNSNNAAQRLSAPTESSAVGSSPATLGRLFQKRSHKSTTDVVCPEGKRCDSNR